MLSQINSQVCLKLTNSSLGSWWDLTEHSGSVPRAASSSTSQTSNVVTRWCGRAFQKKVESKNVQAGHVSKGSKAVRQ